MPLPDGPTTASSGASGEPGDELVDEPLAAEEELGVRRLERREPLERADVAQRARRGAPPPVGGEDQRRILREDRPLELLQLDAGLEPELVVQAVPRLPVHLEPLGLPAAAVEREHQLGAKALAERVLGAERLELGNERQVAAERELGVDPLLDRGQPQLLEPLHLDPREAARTRDRRAAVRATAPPRRAASSAAAAGSPGRERLAPAATSCSNRSRSSSPGSTRAGSRGARATSRGSSAARRAQHLAQPRDVVAQRVVGRVDALLGEELADQPLARDDTVRAQQQQRQQRALLRPADGDRRAVDGHRERAQDPELEAARCHAARSLQRRDALAKGRDAFGTSFGTTRADDLAAMLYTAKCFWPGVTEDELRLAAARRRRVQRGAGAAFRGALHLLGDELVLCLFDAPLA